MDNTFHNLVGDSARIRAGVIEAMCEKSLLDPNRHGVLVVDDMAKMTTEVSLDPSVPWGEIHYKTKGPHEYGA